MCVYVRMYMGGDSIQPRDCTNAAERRERGRQYVVIYMSTF